MAYLCRAMFKHAQVVLLFPGDKYAKTSKYACTCLCVRVGVCEEYSSKLLFLYTFLLILYSMVCSPLSVRY